MILKMLLRIVNKFLQDMKLIARPSSPSIIAISLNQAIITTHLATLIINIKEKDYGKEQK